MDGWPEGLTSRPALLAGGLTDAELRRLRVARTVVTLRPGGYVAADDPRLDDPAARHVLAIEAAVPHLAPDSVVSHVSAAVLHGLPVWGIPLDRVRVTRDRRSGGRRTRRVHVYAAPLESDEIVEVAGMPVTSVARTVADLARTVAFEEAVVVADGALRPEPHGRGLGRPELFASVERAAHRPGCPNARRAVAFPDGRAEGPGESRSRVAMAMLGLPVPILQHDVRDAAGAFLGRVDFWWPERGTVGEFDGRVKYGRLRKPGQDAAEVVWQEKRREDALRDTGVSVVRWTWDELADFRAPAERIRRAFERHRP